VQIAATIGSAIFVGEGDANEVFRFDPVSGVFDEVMSMPLLRSSQPGHAVINDRLYVVGGDGPGGKFDSVDVYTPAGDVWTVGPSMPTARAALGAARSRADSTRWVDCSPTALAATRTRSFWSTRKRR
jgi:hypothetical protein